MTPLLLLLLAQESVVALEGNTYHVQGIIVEADRLYLTSVDRAAAKGFLFEYALPSGKRLRAIEIQQDAQRYHPGGFDADADSFWIPVAEYRRNSTTVIQKRNRNTLALEASFPVNDHIGCVAVGPDRLYGGNWDARDIYEWTFAGREIRKRGNPSQVHYQDLKMRDGMLIGSGLTSGQKGFVEFLLPATFEQLGTREFGKTDRAVLLTHEGMDWRSGRVYFVPEDSPSRLFAFDFPKL